MLLTLVLVTAPAAAVLAQNAHPAEEVVPEQLLDLPPPPENIRIEYVRVISAEPVYQTLRATSMVERCEAATPVETPPERTGLSRVTGAIRNVFRPDEAEVVEVAPSAGGECRMVPIDREFRRPIGYDVEYVYAGVKYRSRMPYDPGNRVRIRVSVTPVVTGADE